jgi:hypothetical protein
MIECFDEDMAISDNPCEETKEIMRLLRSRLRKPEKVVIISTPSSGSDYIYKMFLRKDSQ